jgi:hypothetical protein
MEAVGEEGDEDMRLDARGMLVKDRPDSEVAFEVLERLLDADKANKEIGGAACR